MPPVDLFTSKSSLERFVLTRLERFARVAAAADELAVPQWRRLAHHAVFSAYRDALALGLGQEARAILAAFPRRAPAPRGEQPDQGTVAKGT